MKFTKHILIVIVLALLLSFTACNQDHSGDADKSVYPIVIDAEEQQTYISDIKAVGAYWDKYAFNGADRLSSKYGGTYTRISDWNLNCDCGTTTDCIYLYESRTTQAEEAITGILVIDQKSVDTTITYKNHTYEAVGGIRVNGLNSSTSTYDKFDLNMNAGGDYIYLFVTHDPDAGDPITKIAIGNIEAVADTKDYTFYTLHKFFDETQLQDFNAGAGGDYTFVAYSCNITGWVINTITLQDRDINGNFVTKDIKLDTKDKALTEEMLQPFIDKGEGAHFLGYKLAPGTKDYPLVEVGTEIYRDKTLVACWTYDIAIDFTEHGGDIRYFYNIDRFPTITDYQIWTYYLKETGKSAHGLCWPGTYIVELY